MEKKFCILNGELRKIDELRTSPLFVLNDYVIDNIRLYNTKPLCLGMHIRNMQEAMHKKHRPIPEKFTTQHIERRIGSLLNVNNVYKGGVCVLLIFWQTFPTATQPQYCIFVEPLESLEYTFNIKGYELQLGRATTEIKRDIPFAKCENENTVVDCSIDSNGYLYSAGNHDIIMIRDMEIIVGKTLLPFTSYVVNRLVRDGWSVCNVPHFCRSDFDTCTEILLCDQFIGIQWARRFFDKEDPSEFKSLPAMQAKNIYKEMVAAIDDM